MIPGDLFSIDETLYPMRNKMAFKQFNTNKPVKYGLLFKSINASPMHRIILIHLFQHGTGKSLLENQLKNINLVPLKQQNTWCQSYNTTLH